MISESSLKQLLCKDPPVPAAVLRQRLGGIDRASLMRRLGTLGPELIRLGKARRTAYALRRTLRDQDSSFPLYRIDDRGEAQLLGRLSLIEPQGSALELLSDFPWPLAPGRMRDGWFEGLPYPLYDMAPQGFLGRHFAHQHADFLGVSEDLRDWSDADLVRVLTRLGSDLPGDLILGEEAYRTELRAAEDRSGSLLRESERHLHYPRLAEEAMALGDPDSSAGGEFPKFTARIQDQDVSRSVIVKFSGNDDSPAVRRWADLLISEHLALEIIRDRLEVPAATTQLLGAGGRQFLEIQRFDRTGLQGRRPICTLASLDPALIGLGRGHWPTAADWLARRGWLGDDDLLRIRRLTWFGRLIANNDMHNGNLAFRPGLRLAPVYDMLPMRYAPLRGGEVPPVRFNLPEAPLDEQDDWRVALDAAKAFWGACADEPRISAGFQRLAQENLGILESLG